MRGAVGWPPARRSPNLRFGYTAVSAADTGIAWLCACGTGSVIWLVLARVLLSLRSETPIMNVVKRRSDSSKPSVTGLSVANPIMKNRPGRNGHPDACAPSIRDTRGRETSATPSGWLSFSSLTQSPRATRELSGTPLASQRRNVASTGIASKNAMPRRLRRLIGQTGAPCNDSHTGASSSMFSI